MSKDKRNKIITAAVIVLLVFVLTALTYILYGVYNDYASNKQYKKLSSSVVSETVSREDKKQTGNPIDFKSLKEINPEVFGWIYIPGTEIDYPLLQSEVRDDYYLHRDIYGQYKYAGSIYAEYCNSSELTDRVTVLYGHNMSNGSMFAGLHKFRDTGFFNKHKYFYIYTESRKLKYQIVSAYDYDDRHIMNSFNFAENEVFEEYLSYISNPRSAAKNVRKKLDHKLTVNDRVVTLSTCQNSGDGRYLVQGVLISDEQTQ